MFGNLTFALPTFHLITSILTLTSPHSLGADLSGLDIARAQPPQDLPRSLDLLQTSIEELGQYLTNGSVTSVDLVAAFLAYIERDNHKGLNLRAVIQTAPYDDVLDVAAALDLERESGEIRGRLHGVPILVKDNIATDPILGMDTSAGNFALKGSKVKQDAEVVRKLREAGAIIIGKANLSELSHWKAYSRPGKAGFGEGITNGWSAVGGQTSSAYVVGGFDAGGDPSSSSAGSAVGVSAGFAAAALGTDTIGSVIHPAGRAALFAIRPTTGLVSTAGVVPITADMDTVGPMGSTTRDVAILLDALTYNDGRYLQSTSTSQSRSLRLGLVRKNFLDEADGRMIEPETCIEDVESAMKSTMAILRSELGAEIIDVDMNLDFKDILEFEENAFDLLTMGMSEDMDIYLADLEESPVKDLKDLVLWNDAHSDIELPPGQCCQQRLIETLVSPSRTSTEYTQAWDKLNHLGRDRGLGYLFDRHHLDALVFSPDLGSPMTMIAAMGYAAGIAPMGYCDNGAPFGILFVVNPNEEEKLLSILAQYENVMPRRRAPAQLSKRNSEASE